MSYNCNDQWGGVTEHTLMSPTSFLAKPEYFKMPFKLPEGGPIYTEHIVARTKDLIAHNIWQGLEEIQLSTWLKNFPTDEHRYFAARILDTLMFRSAPQTKSMVTHLFQRTIPDLARLHGLPSDLYSAYDRLRDRAEPNMRLVPVVPSEDPIMSSGPLIARLTRNHLNFRKKWMIRHQEIKPTTPFVVFIDDFIGTGGQFSKFLQRANLEHLVVERRCCFVTLAAHRDGIEQLKSKFPNLAVSGVDLLEPRNGLFHEQSLAFPDGTNSIDDAKAFYNEMLDEIHVTSPRFRGGYGQLHLAYAFEHAVPNNSTPLLWWSSCANWTPLFKR